MSIVIVSYFCEVCGGEVPVEKDVVKTCTCEVPTLHYRLGGVSTPGYNYGDVSKRLSYTQEDILKVIEKWQFFWMNQTINEEDTKRYRERACGIDANMRHDLAEKIMELLK